MPPALWPLVCGVFRTAQPPVIWDIDDAVWIGRRGARRMAEQMARSVDVVVAGNAPIARWAEAAGAKRVEIIPTCYHPVGAVTVAAGGEPDERPVSVVWIGSPASVRLLDAAAPHLRSLFAGTDARLTVIGGMPTADFGDIDIDLVPWSPAAEHAHLTRADYGLGMQPRTEYADHKCGFKLVQYLAYGVIPIATDNPVHREILGDVGHLIADATTTDLARVAVAHRPHPGQRAAARVRWETDYATEVGARQWLELLQSVHPG